MGEFMWSHPRILSTIQKKGPNKEAKQIHPNAPESAS